MRHLFLEINIAWIILIAFNKNFFNFDSLSFRLKNVAIKEKLFKALVDIFQKRGSHLVKVRLDKCGETKIFKLNDIINSISKHLSNVGRA